MKRLMLVFFLFCLVPVVQSQEDPNDPNNLLSIDDIDAVTDEISLDDPSLLDDLGADGGDILDPADIQAELKLYLSNQSRKSNLSSWAPFSGVSPETMKKHHDRVEDLLYNPDASKRSSAARALGRESDSLAFVSLVAGLDDINADVRGDAAKALGQLGSPRALGSLRLALGRERNEAARKDLEKAIKSLDGNVFSSQDADPVVLVCHSCGRKFALRRRVEKGFCPYDGEPWSLSGQTASE